MPRNRIFVSYSHRDEGFLQAFRVHLKPWEDKGLLDIWSDRRIKPSQDWHHEIQQALEATTVAVLLVSPDFLASDYIRKHELPALVRAREEDKIDLACLYLRPSTVEHDASAVAVTLSSAETTHVKLTRYQGFNSPQAVVSALPEDQRDAIYATAATALADLVQRHVPNTSRTLTGPRHELTVQLKLNGQQLTRTYFHHYGRIIEHRSAWQWPGNQPLGQALFATLFGAQEQCDKVLQSLFESELARPIRYPVRIRLQTDTPTLAALPWASMTWEGNSLRDNGWTFELMSPTPLTATPDFPAITLKAPCPVLMIAPSTAPHVEVHHRALEERLSHAWPFYHEKPQWVSNWAGLEQAWQRRRPRIVYYYGPAESADNVLTLHFDTAQGGVEKRPVTALAQLWGDHPPEIVFCNVVDQAVAVGTALAELHVPLRITQSSADAGAARRTALAWFHAVLEEGEDVDPVWALHQHGLTTAIAWGAYGTWRTRTANAPAKDQLAHLLLDRKTQRALGHNAVSELVRNGDRRLCCVLAYGADGNVVELFAEQLYEHLRRNAKEVAQIYKIPLRLPATRPFDVQKLAFEVRRYWGLGDRVSFGEALAARTPRGPGRARPVLLLDWGVQGTTEANRLSLGTLETWVTFCSDYLCAQCPRDLRLMSCLALEITKERHATLEQAVQTWRAEARFRDRAFRLELLPPLDQVDASDLADFLEARDNSSCPDDLIAVMPELIVHNTGGQFRATVDLVEQAEQTSWYELYDQLATQSSRPGGETITKDTLL